MKMIKALLSLSLCFISLFGFAYSDDPSDIFVSCLKHANQSIPSNKIYSQEDPSFTNILDSRIKNMRLERETTPKPLLIVAPTNELQVSTVVLCANKSSIDLKIRSGGHDYEGLSYVSDDPFVILDLFNLDSISVDPKSKTAVVGSGALLGQLYYKISQASETLAYPAGVCPTVAVGGHLSGGGYGNMIRKFGLSVDNMNSATIVVANGSTLTVSGENDLFWALRGGGGASFGVVLSYNISLVTVGDTVTVFRVERFQNESASKILFDYQKCAETCNPSLFIRVLLQPITVGKNKKMRRKKKMLRTTYMGMYVGSAESLLDEVRSNFASLGLKKSDCKEMSWINSVLFWSNFDNTTKTDVLLNKTLDGQVGYFKRKSDYVKSPINKKELEALFDTMVENGKTGMVFNLYGGVMKKIPAADTAFPHRADYIFKIQYSQNWNNESMAAEVENMTQIRKLYKNMTHLVSSNPRDSFLNYRDLDIGTNKGTNNYNLGKIYGRKYFNKNFDRLVRIKTEVDPGNFFRNEQSIPTRRTI